MFCFAAQGSRTNHRRRRRERQRSLIEEQEAFTKEMKDSNNINEIPHHSEQPAQNGHHTASDITSPAESYSPRTPKKFVEFSDQSTSSPRRQRKQKSVEFSDSSTSDHVFPLPSSAMRSHERENSDRTFRDSDFAPKATQIYDSRRSQRESVDIVVSEPKSDETDSPEAHYTLESRDIDEGHSSGGLAPSDFLFGAVTLHTEKAPSGEPSREASDNEGDEESSQQGFSSSVLSPADFFSGDVIIERSASPGPEGEITESHEDLDYNQNEAKSEESPHASEGVAMYPAFSSDACHNSIMAQLLGSEKRLEGDNVSLASTASSLSSSSVHTSDGFHSDPMHKQHSLSSIMDQEQRGECLALIPTHGTE